jgi:polar amino acid transport system ATP-binding protein
MSDVSKNFSRLSNAFDGKGKIVIDNLNKSFDKNIHVLRNLKLEVDFRDRLVIVGPSGSGKSTLLRCIMGLEDIDSGAIYFEGQPYVVKRGKNTWVDKQIQRRIGMIFQHYTLFPHLSVIENLLLSPIQVKKMKRDMAYKQAMTLLERLNLVDKHEVYPSRLSGGQKQRVAIARALMLEPTLMLFDEVTSALDPELVTEVLEVMLQLSKQKMGMIIITHEFDFARRIASRIVFIDEGTVVEEAVPEEFFANPTNLRTKRFLSHFALDPRDSSSERDKGNNEL